MEHNDTSKNGQSAIAKGKGSLAINAAAYSNVTVYQHVTYEGGNATARATTDPSVCPYPGLETFHTSEAKYFAGRGEDIALLEAKLEGHDICGVIAASGAGKSSLVHAGLIAALAKRENEVWDVFAFKPGQQPLYGLARSMSGVLAQGENLDAQLNEIRRNVENLRETTGRLSEYVEEIIRRRSGTTSGKRHHVLIFIDQWEELYTQENDEERDILVRELMEVAERGLAKVLLTMRIDFMEEMLVLSTEFFRDLKPGIYFVEPMDETGLRSAIEVPAGEVGLGVPEALTSRLIADLGKGRDHGSLPYLQFVLRQLWEKRDQATNRLTTEAYDGIKGLKGAIGAHADAVFRSLTKEEQGLAQRVLPRLANVSAAGAITSRRLPFADFDEPARKLLRKLADPERRLVVLSSATEAVAEAEIVAEVAHEALLDDWKTLSGWIADRKDFFRLRNNLETQAQDWEEDGRSKARLLLMGQALRDAKTLVSHSAVEEISSLLKSYIKQCEASFRKRRITLFGMVLSSVVGVSFLLLFLYQVSDQRRDQMKSFLALEAQSYLDFQNPNASVERAIAAALSSWAIAPSNDAYSAAFMASPFLPLYETEVMEGPHAFDVLPDQQHLVVLTGRGSLRVIDIQTGGIIKEIRDLDRISEVHALSKSDRVLLIDMNGELAILDVQIEEEVYRYLPHKDSLSVVVAPSGSHLLITYRTNELRLIDLSKDSEVQLKPKFFHQAARPTDAGSLMVLDHGEFTESTPPPNNYEIRIGGAFQPQIGIAAVFDEDGEQLAIADAKGNVALYHVGRELDPRLFRLGLPEDISSDESNARINQPDNIIGYNGGASEYIDNVSQRRGAAFLTFGTGGDSLLYHFNSGGYGFGVYGQVAAYAVTIDAADAIVRSKQRVRLLEPDRIGWRSFVPFLDSSGFMYFFDRDIGQIVRVSDTRFALSDEMHVLSGDGRWTVRIDHFDHLRSEVERASIGTEDSGLPDEERRSITLDYSLPGPSRFDPFGLSFDGKFLLAREINAQGFERRALIDFESGLVVPFDFVGAPTRAGYLFSRLNGKLRVHLPSGFSSIDSKTAQQEDYVNKAIAEVLSDFSSDVSAPRGIKLAKDLGAVAFTIEDNTIIVFDLLQRRIRFRHELPASISYFDFSPDGSRLFVGMWSHGARLFDGKTGQEYWGIEDNHSYWPSEYSDDPEVFVAMRSGATSHVSAAGDGWISTVGPSPSRLGPSENEFVVFENGGFQEHIFPEEQLGRYPRISISKKGHLLAYNDEGTGGISILDITSQVTLRKIEADLSVFGIMEFSRHDNMLAFVQSDGLWESIKVVDLRTSEVVFESIAADSITSIAWASESDTLTWVESKGAVRLANLEQDKIVVSYLLNAPGPEVEFSEGDGHLISWSGEPIRLLPAKPNKFMSQLCIHFQTLYSIGYDVQCTGDG